MKLTNNLLPRLSDSLLNLVSPNCCALCLMRCSESVRLCRACRSDIEENAPCCPHCALPLTQDYADAPVGCARCQSSPPEFALACVPRLYAPPLSQLISRFKFSGDAGMARVLAELMAGGIVSHLERSPIPDLLLPMPLHWWRKMRRGFNQAELLARALAIHPALQCYALCVDTTLVRRTHATRRQIDLGVNARSDNLHNAFACQDLSAAPHVAIVDDILTTGASANALAEALYCAGARQVDLWACARTPAPEH